MIGKLEGLVKILHPHGSGRSPEKRLRGKIPTAYPRSGAAHIIDPRTCPKIVEQLLAVVLRSGQA